MKKIVLLILSLTNAVFAQLKNADFDVAMNLLMGDDPQKALSNLEALEKKFPADAKVILLRGFYHFRDGNQNAAMMSFSNAIKSDAKYAFAYGARAQLFSTKGMFDRAIADISEAIKLEPNNADFLTTRAGYYNENKQFAEALADTKTKIKLDPNNIASYFDAADFTKEIDANANADDFFMQAYANKQIPKYLTDVMFGQFLLKYGRFEESKIKYESALATNEKDFSAKYLHNVGLVYYKFKNYDKSILYFNKAIAMEPDNVTFYTNLCNIYIDSKDWQKVLETAQVAVNVDANDSVANMCMAIGLSYTGNQSRAEEFEAKAKRLEAEQN